MGTFVEALERRRVELGLSHRAFARYIGLQSHAGWVLVRQGRRPAGPGFVGRVLMTRPELAQYLSATTAEAA